MRLTTAESLSLAPAPRVVQIAPQVQAPRWALHYLILATVLAPILLPAGPGQTAAIDAINILALIAFVFGLRQSADSVRLPLLTPLLLIAAGSLIAVSAAVSLGASAITLAQDLYLYMWFVMLVSLIGDRPGDGRAVRVAWLWTANLIAAIEVASVAQGGLGGLLSIKGVRPAATLYNPNMCADYLVLSVFNALGLHGQVRARWLVPSLGLLALALMATKSNGGWISLAAGLACWFVLRVLSLGASSPRLAGLLVLALAGALAAGWFIVENTDSSRIQGLLADTFVSRVEKSTASRGSIWRGLRQDLTQSPVGIGPGNSSQQSMAIGERVRPDSFQSKEAHSDYIAYLAERGPLGFAGLIAAIAILIARVMRGVPALMRRTGDERRAEVIRAALMGALVAAAVHSLVIERLHFRHGWMFLGLLWAITGPPPGPETVVTPIASRPHGGHGGAA